VYYTGVVQSSFFTSGCHRWRQQYCSNSCNVIQTVTHVQCSVTDLNDITEND